MDLSRISIEARVRSPWEALDLGFVLARVWWKPLFLSWLIPSSILFVLLTLIMYRLDFYYDWLPMVIVWWLKPLWDRLPLYVASRALFGEQISAREITQNSLDILKAEWFPWLTWRRFSPTRGFDMPVTVLERLTGEPRQKRLSVLRHNSSGVAIGLLMICVHVEFIIMLGIYSLIALFIPEEVDIDYMGLLQSEDGVMAAAGNIFTLLGMALVAPFYTVAAFTLYICRRIELEAWDIEIRFRHLAEMHKPKKTLENHKSQAATILGSLSLFLLVLSLMGIPQPSVADDSLVQANSEAVVNSSVEAYERKLVKIESRAQAQSQIDEVLAGDDYHKMQQFTAWRLKDREQDDDPDKEPLPEWFITIIEFFENNEDSFKAYENLFSDGAVLIEFLLWALVISLLIFIAYRYRDFLQTLVSGEPNTALNEDRPDLMFGLDVREESVPEDVVSQVESLWAEGNFRAALSLLYRATLSSLIHQHGFHFYDGFTEAECAAIVRQQGDKRLGDYTQRLTLQWQRTAYGHRVPDSHQVEALCLDWREIFQNE